MTKKQEEGRYVLCTPAETEIFMAESRRFDDFSKKCEAAMFAPIRDQIGEQIWGRRK